MSPEATDIFVKFVEVGNLNKGLTAARQMGLVSLAGKQTMGKSKGRKESACLLGQDEVLGDKTEGAWAVCFEGFSLALPTPHNWL